MFYSSLVTNAEKDLDPKFAKAVSYLRGTDFSSLPDGEYDIEGRDIYAKVFTLTSKPRSELRAEFHKLYADVQYWIDGTEHMGVSFEKAQDAMIDEHPEDDVSFLDKVRDEREVEAHPGDYMILLPEDIHTPGIAAGEPSTYRKVVVKVKVR